MKAVPWQLLVLAGVGISIAGCGGSGATQVGYQPPASTTMKLGNFTLKTAGPLTSIGGGSGGAVVTGLAGASISELKFLGADINSTRILYDQNSVVYSVEPDGVNPTMLTSNQSLPGSTGAHPSMNSHGQIVFQCLGNDLTYHINVANADGSGQHTVAATAATDIYPRWSPDGTKIIFSRQAGGTLYQIMVMNADGSGLTPRSDGLHVDYQPCMSPDGSTIAFSRMTTISGNSVFQIFLSPSGTSAVPLASDDTNAHELDPSWSPDGTKIVCTSESTISNAIYLSLLSTSSSLNSSITYNLASYDFSPNFSPDGKHLVWGRSATDYSTQTVMVANADGTNAVPIAGSNPPALWPTWSPFPYRLYVGGSGILGTTASAFLFSQDATEIHSVLAFSATTPGTATAKKDPNVDPGSDALVFDLSADHITGLRYVNDLYASPTTIVPTSGFTTAAGAIVSYSSGSGKITSILPYASPKSRPVSTRKGNALVYTGTFLAAYDGKGKNAAPGGASSITLERKTGKVVSFVGARRLTP